MAEVTSEASFTCSTDDVWSVLADFEAIARWAPNVDHSCLTTEQCDGLGAVRRVQAGRTVVLETVTEWESGRRLAYEISGLPPAIDRVTNTWQIDETSGGAKVALTSRVEVGPRPPQQLAARAIARVLSRTSQQMLDGLRTELEGAST